MEPQSSSSRSSSPSSSTTEGSEPDEPREPQARPEAKKLKTLWRIFLPRLGGSALVVAVSLLGPTLNRPLLHFSLAAYFAALLLLTTTLPVEYIRLKRMRLLRATVDILCITFVTHATGKLESLWFLAYAFPIILVSKHLKQLLIYVLAIFALVSYVLINSGLRPDLLSLEQIYVLAVESLLLFGLVVLAAKLNKSEQDREERLLEAIEEILALSAHSNLRDALQALITKSVEFTGSSHGLLQVNNPAGDPLVVEAGDLTAENQVRISAKISFDDAVIGEIRLSSHRRFHYYSREREVLKRLAALGAIAFRNTDLLRQIQIASEERKKRLRMLYDIGEQLTATEDFQRFLDRVVSLTLQRLDSEEAALFLPSENNTELIEKVAVEAAAPDLTPRLAAVEVVYKSGESLTGQVYASGKKKVLKDIPISTEHAREYSKLLPSKVTKHYIGVPLKIGGRTIGVLRVLNKKSNRYSPEKQRFALSQDPFSEEDEELMETIASQVAVVLSNTQLLARAQKSERYLKNIILNSPDPIIVVDENGRIKIFNHACVELFECSESDAKDESVVRFYATEKHAREIGRAMWEAKDHRIQNLDALVAGPNKKPIPVSLSASWLLDETKKGKDKRIGSVGIFKDQREINRLRDEKLQNAKLTAIGRLAHTVGHELKHDIGAALFYVEPLLREARRANDLESQDVYESMRDILWGATAKLQNLLMVGKPRKPKKQHLPIADVFREVDKAISKQAADRRIELQFHYPPKGHGVEIDVDQFLQVFSNLFTNSVHAIQKRREIDPDFANARIEVRLSRTDSANLEISWADNGCGIEDDKLPHVFEAFYTDKVTGNGLGLFLTKEILRNHGGAISIDSAKGQGARVTLKLPTVHSDAMIEEKT
jgi:PAS domain S-box-containing protein